MDIAKLENELFLKWQTEQGYEFFIKDGVTSPQEWAKESVKVTFILKEANWTGANGDLKEMLLSDSSKHWRTWNNVARWAKAILDGGDYLRYVSKSDRADLLSRISFINLKKVGGGSAAKKKDIKSFAKKDSKYIIEQLNIYKPDIIICCGKGTIAGIMYESVLPKETLSSWKKTSGDFDYFLTKLKDKESPTPVVCYEHPQRIASHAKFEKWYTDIKDIANELIG